MNPTNLPPLRLATPDRTYRLSPEERARVTPGFDVDALDRLLGMITPDLRSRILQHFLLPTPAEAAAGRPPGLLFQLNDPQTGEADPVLQAALEDVYAPLWDDLPDEAFDERYAPMYPGRERAKLRREARHRDGQRGPGGKSHK